MDFASRSAAVARSWRRPVRTVSLLLMLMLAAGSVRAAVYDSLPVQMWGAVGTSGSFQASGPDFSYTIGNDFPGIRGTVTGSAPTPPVGTAVIGDVMQLVAPLRIHWKVDLQVEPVLDGSPPTTTYTVRVNTVFSGRRAPVVCEEKTLVSNIPSGKRTDIPLEFDCTMQQVPLLFGVPEAAAAKLDALVNVRIEGETNGGWSVVSPIWMTFEYVFLARVNSIDLKYPSPDAGAKLDRSRALNLSGVVEYRMRTRPSATAALRLHDQAGVLVGSSEFVTVPQSTHGWGDPLAELKIKDVYLDDSVTALTMKAVLIDRVTQRILAESSPVNYGVTGSGCAFKGMLRRRRLGREWWLPGVKVELLRADTQNVVQTTRAVPDPRDPDVESSFCFPSLAGVDLAKDHVLQLTLQDAATDPKLQLFHRYADSDPITIRTKPFTIEPVRDFSLTDGLDLDVTTHATPGLPATAIESYWNLWRQIHRMWPKMSSENLKRIVPLKLVFETKTCYWSDRGTIELGPADAVPEVLPDTLWHEFGHHVVWEIYGGRMKQPSVPPDTEEKFLIGEFHAGFSNTFTSLSMDEAISTFWAVMSKRELDGYKDSNFQWTGPGAGVGLEFNMPMWDGRRDGTIVLATTPAQGEEFALAGLLWDLVDDAPEAAEAAPDVTWGAGAVPSDRISIPARRLMDLIRSTRPTTALQLHAALKSHLEKPLTTPGANGVSALDELFLMHRIFHDANGNWKYDAGEVVGKSANGATWKGYTWASATESFTPIDLEKRPWRESLPQLPGSNVRFTLTGSTGQPVEKANVRLDLTYPAPFEQMNSSSIVPVVNGEVYFQMPPAHYGATATITVPGGSEPPLVITSAEYWGRSMSESSFVAKSLRVPDPPSVASVEPLAGGPGSSVVIQGIRFGATAQDNAVMFSDRPASIVSASETRIEALVPELAGGAVPLRVLSGGESEAVNFTVLAPSLTAVSSLDCGTTAPGSSVLRSLTIGNSGVAPLVIRQATFETEVFSLETPLPLVIPAGGSGALSIRFRPPAEEQYDGSITLESSDAARSPQAIGLTGIGGIVRTGKLALGTAALRFSGVQTGSSRTANVLLRNDGGTPFNVRSAVSSNAQFSVTSAFPLTIAPGATQTIAVRYAPTSAGSLDAQLTIASEDATGSSQTLNVRGEATGAAATACDFGLGATAAMIPAAGGSATIAVTSTGGCNWSAASAAAWLTIAPASASGAASVVVSAGRNDSGKARSTTVTIAGISVTVGQPGSGRRRALRH